MQIVKAVTDGTWRSKVACWAKQGVTKWEREGTLAAIASALRKLARHYRRKSVPYDEWIASHEADGEALDRQRQEHLANEPLISLVTATCNTPVAYLKTMLQSVLDQTYPNWELCIVDAGSRDPQLREMLNSWATSDSRIKLRFLPETLSAADDANSAISLAAGDYLAFLNDQDSLSPFALYEVVRAVNRYPEVDCLYSDDDRLDSATGQRCDPHFKPAWSPELLRACNYIRHLTIIRRQLVDEVGRFRPGFEGAHDYDLLLRTTERARCIVHIPHILYHARKQTDAACSEGEPEWAACEASRKALREHLVRCQLPGTVRHGRLPGYYHVTHALPRRPLVSIIIPNRDQLEMLRRCLHSLWLTDYEHCEIIIVENGSRDPGTHAYYAQLAHVPNVKIVEFSGQFNYSAVVNLGVRNSAGEVVVQLNNDTQAINSDWLERMLEHALRPEIGAVGAKLYYPDNGRIQHAGAIVGLGGIAGHALIDEPRESIGYAGRLITIQNCSVVTGACLMTRRNVFDEVGGLDEEFPLDCNDADFCLKIRQRGYLNVWTPLAELYHFESLTRGAAPTAERLAHLQQAGRRFQEKWAGVFRDGDPYYNPNLSLKAGGYELRLDSPQIHSRAA